MFNYLIGNSDAHAKNVSVLIDETGYALAPFYDLLCVQVYGDERLALFIGDEDRYASVGAHSWEAFCQDCGFSVKPTLSLFREMAQDVTKALSSPSPSIRRLLLPSHVLPIQNSKVHMTHWMTSSRL